MSNGNYTEQEALKLIIEKVKDIRDIINNVEVPEGVNPNDVDISPRTYISMSIVDNYIMISGNCKTYDEDSPRYYNTHIHEED